MLRKLLKYDFRALWKMYLLLTLVAVGASVAGGYSFGMFANNVESDTTPEIFSVMTMLFGMACIMTVFAGVFVMSIMAYVRFYKNLYTDEGYLTFTLPATRRQILISKSITNILTMLYSAVVVIVCMFLIIGTALSFSEMPPVEDPGVTEPLIFDAWAIGYILFALIAPLLSVILEVGVVQLCITLGAVLVKRAKLIVGIALYYGINTVLSFTMQTVISLATFIFLEPIVKFFASLTETQVHLVLYGVMLLVLVILAAIIFLVYFLTERIMTRKLNLP